MSNHQFLRIADAEDGHKVPGKNYIPKLKAADMHPKACRPSVVEEPIQCNMPQRVYLDCQYGIRAQKPYHIWVFGT